MIIVTTVLTYIHVWGFVKYQVYTYKITTVTQLMKHLRRSLQTCYIKGRQNLNSTCMCARP
jgi:hypothetical protein